MIKLFPDMHLLQLPRYYFHFTANEMVRSHAKSYYVETKDPFEMWNEVLHIRVALLRILDITVTLYVLNLRLLEWLPFL